MKTPLAPPLLARSWSAGWRLLERDERLFAVLLAVVMVGGLATLGLFPLGPRHRINVYSLVLWFAAYKAGVFALVTVIPRATRAIFTGALAVDLLLVFGLLYLTGGVYSVFYLLFFPLVAVNAYYFGPWLGLLIALVAGLLYAAAAALAPPWEGWTPVIILSGLVGLPAFALGHVAERERRARAEVDRLNAEVTGTLTRLQAAQEELVVAERMATVGRLSLKVAHEVRNPIAAIELNAEMVGDIVREHAGPEMEEAASLVQAIRDQVNTLDALTEEYLAFARFPRPHYEDDSVNEMVVSLVEFVRPLATRQGIALHVSLDAAVPPMAIDRTLLRQAVLNLVKNGLEVLAQGGALTVATRRVDDTVEIVVTDTGPGIPAEVGARLFEQFFTTKPQGTGLGLYITRQIVEEHGGHLRWMSAPGSGATFVAALPIKRSEHV
ncbi:MAG: ATP-binding protein [Candidatus Rokubacteria bacterium]|nr:ATP-binding protein [Candidatus Rokubacteria bacterium]